jgi:signal transduction histidine kinase
MDFTKGGRTIPQVHKNPKPMIPLAIRLLALSIVGQALEAAPAGEVLKTALEVISLTAERAEMNIPVSVEGVVTAAEPNWEGRFFIQDATAGVFVENVSTEHPLPGDLVRVTGVSNPGGFAPIIGLRHWEKLGTAPLPPAKQVSTEQLMSGIEDSQRIEISGIVRTVRVDSQALVIHLQSEGFRIQAIAPLEAAEKPAALVGAKVRLRGTAAATFNPQLRQVVAWNLFIPQTEDFIVERMEQMDPFQKEPVSLASVGQYRRDRVPGERVRVQGRVTYFRPGEGLFISGPEGGLQIKSEQAITLNPGEWVDVVGFPYLEQHLPVLQDAVIRPGHPPVIPVTPKQVPLEELRMALHHGDLIRLQGTVLNRTVTNSHPAVKGAPAERLTLTLKAPDFLFSAEIPLTGLNSKMVDLPLGGIVELSGICMLKIASDGRMESVHLLVPGIDNVRIVKAPSWLTPQRLLIGLSLLSVVLMVAFAWLATVSRKNRILKRLNRERAKAQEALVKANETLDQRVRERSARLKFEMNERKEAEVRFKATLAERTRLAQELHDTTEQSLTGIGLQLDAAAKLIGKGAGGFERPLEMARTLISQSHLELRQSIWDLRSRELEQFDLPNALRISGEEILEGTGVEFNCETNGIPRPLSEVVEENLLRIGREALNNVVKHAAASRVELTLTFTPDRVIMKVSDNGCGFYLSEAPGAREGHFGLLGMTERAKRFDGNLNVVSEPGKGTLMTVEIPTHARHTNLSATGSTSREHSS